MLKALGIQIKPMKIPEPLFKLINLFVRGVLSSPLHFMLSKSVMVITFTGRNSGREYSTPVRYDQPDGVIRAFTSDHGQWWRNLRNGADAELLIKGVRNTYQATILGRDPELTREKLIEFLSKYPQDAIYQDIRLNKDGTLREHDLKAASVKAIVVEFQRV